jgi:hypothetical protein
MIGHDAGAQRQPGIEGTPRDVDARDRTPAEEAHGESKNPEGTHLPMLSWQQAQTCPGCRNGSDNADRKIPGLGVRQNQPES